MNVFMQNNLTVSAIAFGTMTESSWKFMPPPPKKKKKKKRKKVPVPASDT